MLNISGALIMQGNIAHQIPVHILTGFLGSGKTTLLNRLLQHPEISEIAVLINELGVVGVDHLIVDTFDDDVILLESGCVCCSVRDDFTGLLLELVRKRSAKLIPPFNQVVLETTGVADPLAILQVLMLDKSICNSYRTGSVVTVIDGIYGHKALQEHIEALRQVVIADHLVLSKTDIAEPSTISHLKKEITNQNSTATMSYTQDSSPRELFEKMSIDDAARIKLIEDYFNSDFIVSDKGGHGDGSRFSSFCLSWIEAVAWSDLNLWLDGLLYARGNEILRLKGIVHIKDENRPVIIQGVQFSLYEPQFLMTWPGGTPRTNIVFITSDFTKKAAINSIKSFFDLNVK